MAGILVALLALGVRIPGEADAASCRDCHDLVEKAAGAGSLHPPFKDGECDSCHLDHGESPRLLLTEEGNDLCLECHDTVEKFKKAHHDFTSYSARCSGCHDPHWSPTETLLRADRHRPVAEGRCKACHRRGGKLLLPRARLLCLSCHPKESYAGTSIHEPVRKGECLTCHDPHGSPERALLKGRYSGERWLQQGERDYALCNRCHEGVATGPEGPPSGTGFRTGGKDLHRLHVGGGGEPSPEGSQFSMINCRNCHYAHASENEHLVRSELDCGGVLCLKLSYRSLPDGGECRSGCHGLKTYGGREAAASAGGPSGSHRQSPADRFARVLSHQHPVAVDPPAQGAALQHIASL